MPPPGRGSDLGAGRRGFLRAVLGAAAVPLAAGMRSAAGQGPGPLAGRGATGSLRDPSAAGPPRARTEPGEDGDAIKAIELRLHCTCGCNLDVYTCRTTDFSCSYSPRMHREVLALAREGKTAQQILDAFVAEYGESVLMAPKPEGFNLMGYLVPGGAVALGAAVLAFVIGRRERRRSLALAAASGAGAGPARAQVAATPEELERLRRALEEVED